MARLNNLRLLLAATVDSTQAVVHCGFANSGNTAVGETFLQDIQRALIIGMTENRDHDGAITDVKIRIAGRQTQIIIADEAGHRKLDDVQVKPHKPLIVVFQYPVVPVGGSFFAGAYYGVVVNEASDIVNVTIRVVP